MSFSISTNLPRLVFIHIVLSVLKKSREAFVKTQRKERLLGSEPLSIGTASPKRSAAQFAMNAD
jgi:hypothetical protein